MSIQHSQFSLYIHEYTETLQGRGDEGREGEERESNDCNDLTVSFISAMHLLTKIITFSAEKLIKLLTQLGSTLIEVVVYSIYMHSIQISHTSLLLQHSCGGRWGLK